MRVSICSAAVASTLLGVATAAGAQKVAASSNVWSTLYGCWSTSSAGVVGPTICVVPTDSALRAEFISVTADSVATRTAIDASGTPRAFARGGCAGFEKARWSGDARRLYLRTEYRCNRGPGRRSDGIISMTQAGAFTFIERSTLSDSAAPQVVNFIARVDLGSVPAEIRERLVGRVVAAREMESDPAQLTDTEVSDAFANVDRQVVSRWLEQQGQQASASMPAVAVASRPSTIWPRYAALYVDRHGRATVRGVSSGLPISVADDAGLQLEPFRIDDRAVPAGGFPSNGSAIRGTLPPTSTGVGFRWP